MSTASPPGVRPSAHFANAAEWLAALGGVPLERILFDPPPGTASESDLLRLVKRDKRLCEFVVVEMQQKLIEYFQSGTVLAWIVDPSTHQVAIYHSPGKPTRILQETESLDGESVLPGLIITIADLFQNIPRA